MKKNHKALPAPHASAVLLAALAGLGSPSAAFADEPDPATLEALKRQVVEQTERLEALREAMRQEEAKLAEIRRAMGMDELEATRGAGPAAPSGAPPAPIAQAPARQQQPVGQKPPTEAKEKEPPVAQIFNEPGILTQPGKYILEPSLEYSYSANSRVALVGYTVIPALTIGLIDVREVKRNTWTAALTARTGLTNRMEFEVKVPWVYRSDEAIRRPLAAPSSTETVFNSEGRGLGDIEFTGRYQLNKGGASEPFYVASLRFKTRTGKDQFDTTSIRTVPGFVGYASDELPTGSGFYSLQPGVTFLLPSDPVVFFGGINYQYSFERKDVKVTEFDGVNTTVTELDSVQPGGVLGFNFGMGLALNERSSFSIGYDHASVGITKVNGREDPLGVRVQLGTLLLGYAYRLTPDKSLNLSLGVGVTRDTPDVTLKLRVPMTF